MLKELNRKEVDTPERPVKVLQFGEGNFLRGFVDWIIDILNEKTDFNGNVVAVQPIASGMSDMINAQDGLYHVLLNGIENGQPVRKSRLITSLVKVVNPYNDYEAYLKLAENPELQFVISNTTEAGIAFDENDKLDSLQNSFPGKLTALLYHRFKYFDGAQSKTLKIIPCELIDKNGTALKKIILQYISIWGLPEDFKNWIEKDTLFCNTLVDRIVPGFPADKIEAIKEDLGYADKLVVMGEPFHLWVIEGPETLEEEFPVGQAGLEVKFVADQSPYRTRKVRILNGAHTSMVPVAYLEGLRTVQEAVEDQKIRPFIEKVIYEEIIPTLDLPEEELKKFAHDVLERFENPFVRHELISISLNSISKFKVRVLPSLLEYRKRKGVLPENLVTSFAALILFYKGEINGVQIPLSDSPEVIQFMKNAWAQESIADTVNMVLSNTSFWGQDLTLIPGLQDRIIDQLR